MKILLYVEPLVFHNNPYHYWAWIRQGMSLINQLKKAGKPLEYRLIANEPLKSEVIKYPHERDKNIYIQQREIFDIFQANNTEIVHKYHHGCSPEELSQLKSLFDDKLNGFEPELVITFSPANFFKDLYNIPVFYFEIGAFSRPPFLHTSFIDPLGQYQNSYIHHFRDEIKSLKSTPQDEYLIQNFKNSAYEKTFVESPFHALERKLRREFRKILLLPLHTSHHLYFTLNYPFESQTELLMFIAENTPDDVAVIVTFHNVSLYINDTFRQNFLDYLEYYHPNIIIDQQVRSVLASSQFLMHHVDGLINISASLGAHALLWDKPLVNIGYNNFESYCTSPDYQSFFTQEERPQNGNPYDYDNQAVLAWMFRHYYYIVQPFYEHKTAYYDFMKRSLDKAQANQIDFSFYEPFDTDENIVSVACDYMKTCELSPNYDGEYKQIVRSLFKGERFEQSEENKAKNAIMNGDFSIHESMSLDPDEFAASWFKTNVSPEFLSVEIIPVELSEETVPSENQEYCLRIETIDDVTTPAYITQRIPQLQKYLDTEVTVSFWARAISGSAVTMRFFMNASAQHPGNQLTNRNYVFPTEDWQLHSFTFRLSAMEEPARGFDLNSVLEFVIEIPESPAGMQVDLTGFVLTKSSEVIPIALAKQDANLLEENDDTRVE